MGWVFERMNGELVENTDELLDDMETSMIFNVNATKAACLGSVGFPLRICRISSLLNFLDKRPAVWAARQ